MITPDQDALGLSDDAAAILAYARRWGVPFTRVEITDIAPGAAWDSYSRWPKTVAKLDPIRELMRAGLIEQHDEQPVKSDRRGRKHYKRWRLTAVESVPSLADLLDRLEDAAVEAAVSRIGGEHHGATAVAAEAAATRAEILRRFDRPGSAP